jgi:hypothetical protein
MDFAQNYNELRFEGLAQARWGLGMQTFIPVVLDPNLFPRRDKKHDVIINKKTGQPEPAFCGKNPSFWTSDGRPVLAKPNQPCSLEEYINRIDIAAKLNKPIGIGVIPKPPLVIIDIDLKAYASAQELNADLLRMSVQYPDITSTRIEVTPGGGRHISVIVSDLSEWEKLNQGFHCSFSTTIGGPHRGEVLTGNRFCACAPSMRFDGKYQVRFPMHAYDAIKVERLSDLGIYPTAQKQLKGNQRPVLLLPPGVDRKDQQGDAIVGTADQLRQVLTKKARLVLEGQAAYNADDRSGTLAAFGNELNSWNNLAAAYDHDFADAVLVLYDEAAHALDCEDKADRVFQTLDPGCEFAESQWAEKRFEEVIGIRTSSLLLAEVPAKEQGRNQHQLPQDDMTIEGAIKELVRLSADSQIDAKKLMPPYLQAAFSVIRSTIGYDLELMLTVLMVGLSGALPLESTITLIAGDFVQPLSLLAVLLMPTGELKTPLVNRLVREPWKTSVDVVMHKRYQDALSQWKQLKAAAAENGDDPEIPQPRKPQTLITDDLTVQGVERHLVLHERFANGSVLLLFDEGKDLLTEMAGQSTVQNHLKLGSWILSRYDGSGGRGAKADEQLERHYAQCRVAALFCCQPEVYRSITGDSDQTGLSARFVAFEQNTVDQVFPAQFDDSYQKNHVGVTRLLSDLYSYVCDRDSIELELTDEALALFQKERQWLQDRKNQTLSEAERGQLNKCHGRIGRLAGGFHLLWSFDPLNPRSRHLPVKVEVESMQRAIDMNRYLLSQSVLVRQTSSGNSLAMQKILAFHNRALKVKRPVRITDLRVQPNSLMRLKPAEAQDVAQALHNIGVGKLTVDNEGKHCYQALKPMGT